MPMVDIQRRHAEVFRIRFGDKGRNGAPQKLTDSIRITSPSAAVVTAFTEVYGGECKPWNGGEGAQFEAYLPTTELPIMVLPGQSLVQWWELYRGSVCERRCDGEVEQLSGKPCMCPADLTVRMKDANACRPMTRVAVLCPDVDVVGAGSFVSHGMIAAETLPQAIAVAEAALARGLMVPGVVRVVEHKGKRHYIVPQIEIVGVSLRALATGEIPDAIPAGSSVALSRAETPALPAPAAEAPKKAARSTKAAKKAAAPASTNSTTPPAAAGQPPLPGEEEPAPFVLADETTRKELADALASYDAEIREILAEGWKENVGPSLKAAERFGASHAEAAWAFIDRVEKETHLRRQKRANANMGEVGVTTDDDRHALVHAATEGQTQSTAHLTESQVAKVVDYCEAMKRDGLSGFNVGEDATGDQAELLGQAG